MGFRFFISYLYNIMEDEFGLQFNSWICWYYTQGMGRTSWFLCATTIFFFLQKVTNIHSILMMYAFLKNFIVLADNMRVNPGDVWEFSHVHYCQESRTLHPTQKPEGLMERMILASSNEEDVVVDPFAGSGTTLRVCQQLKRKCIGIELSDAYLTLINKRLSEPFYGFDSIDQRMKRIPNDLNDPEIREQYEQP